MDSCKTCGLGNRETGKPADNKACDMCLNNPTKQKYEEIKRMAWELLLSTSYHDKDKKTFELGSPETAWAVAEQFYDYVKEKENENE